MTVFYKKRDGTVVPVSPGPRGEQGEQGPQGDGALVDEGDVDSPPAGWIEGEFLWDENAEPDPAYTPLTQAQADARYVNADGDTMTGNLTISKTDPRATWTNGAHSGYLLMGSTGSFILRHNSSSRTMLYATAAGSLR